MKLKQEIKIKTSLKIKQKDMDLIHQKTDPLSARLLPDMHISSLNVAD